MHAFNTIKKYALALIEHYNVSQGIYNSYGKKRAAELTAELNNIEAPASEDAAQQEINAKAAFTRLSADLASFCKSGQTENDMKSSSIVFSLFRSSRFKPTSLRGIFLSFFTKPVEATQLPVETFTLTEIQKNIVARITDMSEMNANDARNGLGIIERKIQLLEEINNWIIGQAGYLGRSHGVVRAMELVRKINQAPNHAALDVVTLDFVLTGKTENDNNFVNKSIYKPSGTGVTSLRGKLIFWLLGRDVDKQQDFLQTLNSKTCTPIALATKLGFPITEALDPKPVITTKLAATV